jgi:carboxymethylenebutenolidase
MLARRGVILGAAGLPLALPALARILANPLLAAAVAGTLEEAAITTEKGRSVKAALALPATTPAPAVLLIHEWWGLNDQIKSMAAELAREGYLALAVDLFEGKVTAKSDEARALVGAVRNEDALDTLAAWIGWLKRHPKSTGKVATLGWCFGGAWALNAAIAAPVDATIVYYGRVTRVAADLKNLKGPVLGHFARRDQFIDEPMVMAWEAEMQAAGKAYRSYWYEADHAFANPTGGRYDAEDAKLAWRRTFAFLKAELGD